MSRQYWSTKQLRIELQSSILTVTLLVIIHLLSLLALTSSKVSIVLLVLLIGAIAFSFRYCLYRYGLLLSPDSIEALEFKQQCWQFKLRNESVYQTARVVGRLAFGVVMLEVRGSKWHGSSLVLLTKAQLSSEQYRVLKGLVISA